MLTAPWARTPASRPGLPARKLPLKGYVCIEGERCKGCSLCIDFCPKDSILLSEELNLKGYFIAVFDAEAGCNACGSCALMCPEGAIEVMRT